MRNVATFWKEETKYSLRYLPTSGLARAFTRSASALFQVKRGSSKCPETCSTKTSFSCFFASTAASDGVATNSTLVPWVWHVPSPRAPANPGRASASPSTAPNSQRLMSHLLRLLDPWPYSNRSDGNGSATSCRPGFPAGPTTPPILDGSAADWFALRRGSPG